jgi:hypothetical protein
MKIKEKLYHIQIKQEIYITIKLIIKTSVTIIILIIKIIEKKFIKYQLII